MGINAILPKLWKNKPQLEVEYLKDALNSTTFNSLLMIGYLPFLVCSRSVHAINKNNTNPVLTKIVLSLVLIYLYKKYSQVH